jgi:hypothetical protein
MNEKTCKVCNQTFDTEQQLREHEKTAHGAGKKEQDRPTGERQQQPSGDRPQHPGSEKIAS